MTHYALSESKCGDSGMMIERDVIILGAGISGLTAAYRLLQKDSSLRILVLEAKGWRFLLHSWFFIVILFL
jgi:glycine/D-amino acid oxidase-like deaminating enzyme